MTRPVVVVTEPLDEEAMSHLRRRCGVHQADLDDPQTLRARLADADGLVVRTYTRVDAELLSHAPKLRVVGRAGVGLDNVDGDACAARGIAVLNTPDANTDAVVEYVLALILDAIRPRVFLKKSIPEDQWRRLRDELIAPRQLSDLTVGVYGMGRIGSRVARALAPLAGRVLYHDLVDVPESHRFGALPVDRDALLRESDILTLHVDGRRENRGLIDAAALVLMKPDAALINTARGFVIDDAALAAHLAEKPDAIAMLDVHEPEPIPPGAPLLGIENAHLAPHLGAATARAKKNMSWVVRDVCRALGVED